MLAFGSGLILFHNVDIEILYRLETGVHGQLCFPVPIEGDLHVKSERVVDVGSRSGSGNGGPCLVDIDKKFGPSSCMLTQKKYHGR